MSKLRTGRMRAIAAVLEKVVIFVAMAVLTYVLIAFDTRAWARNVPPDNSGYVELTKLVPDPIFVFGRPGMSNSAALSESAMRRSHCSPEARIHRSVVREFTVRAMHPSPS